jgi:hypothetical protein
MNPIRPEEGFLAETPEGGVQFQTALRGGFGQAAAEYAPETKAGVEGVQVADASADLKALEALGGGKMDDTYRDVLSKRSGSDNLKWLEEYGASRGLVEPQAEANAGEQPQSDGELWKGSGLKPGSMFNAAGNVVGDVFGGLVTEGASTYLGHAAKGLQNTVNGLVSATGGVSGWLEKNGYGLPGGLQVTDPETGAFDPKLLSTEEFKQFQEKGGSPEVSIPGASLADQNQTVTGNLVGGMVQFLTGLGLVGKATGGLSTANTVGGATKRLGQYYLADLAAWDGQEGNLANFVQSYPALQNPIAEWLATDEETPELEGRLKNAIAGAVPNAITEVTLQWLKGVKEARRLKSLTKSDTVQEAIAKVESGQAQIQRPTVDSILGNPADDLVQRPQPSAVAQAQSILKPVETGVPDQVAAKSLLPGSHKAPDIAPGMKRVYRVEPKGSATLPVEEYIDDLATAQADLKAKTAAVTSAPPRTGIPLNVRAYRGVGGDTYFAHPDRPPYFSSDRPAAQAYADLNENPRVHEVGLEFKNPLVVDAKGAVYDGIQWGRREVDTVDLANIAKERGYDGLVVLNVKDSPLGDLKAKPTTIYAAIDASTINRAGSKGAGQHHASGDFHIVYQDIPADTQASGSGRYEVRNNIPDQATGAPGANAGVVSDAAATAQGNFSQDVYVNWSRINTADDVKSAMGQMADAMQDEIKTATRGKVSNAQTAALAGDENAWALLLGERKGNIPNAHEQLAMRKLWASSGQKLLETAKLAATGGDAEMYAFRKMMAIHNTVQQTVIGVRSETARALQQWRMPAGAESMQLAQMKLMLETGGGSDVTKELATKLALLGDDPQALDVFVRKSVGARTVAAVREYWINALLSNPKTHIVNVTSNGLVFAQSLAERMVAGHLAGVLDPVDGVKSGEALYMMMGAKESLKDALSAAVRVMKTGESTYARSLGQPGHEISAFTPAISAEAFDVKGNHLAKAIDMIGSIIRVPGTAMQAGDEFFKIINSRAEIWAQALRMASEEVERGQLPKAGLKARIADIIANPPENILMKAADMASYNTFTSEPDAITKSLLKLRNQIPGGMMVMPFVNTPSNILKFSFERTPLAPLVGRFRADIAAGGARRDLALAKIGLGSLVMSVGYDLAMDGHLSGGGPEGDKRTSERQAMARAGWQRYSMRVMTGQDADGNPEYRYFAYNRLDPVGMYLGMAADMADMARNADLESAEVTQTFEQIAVAAAFAAADNMMDKTYLSGFATFVDAIREPGRYGDQFFKKLAGSMVPAVVAEGARQVDPYGKQAIDMIEQMKSRVPYLSKDVPNRLNMWGDPVQYSSGLGNAYDALSPVSSRTNKGADPIEREFFKLNYFPPDSVDVDLKGTSDPDTLHVNLRNFPQYINEFKQTAGKVGAADLLEENEDDMRARKGVYRSYVKTLSGLGDRTMKESLNDLVTGKLDSLSLDYEAADDREKIEMVKDIMRAYRGAARVRLIREHPDVQDMRDRLPSRADRAKQAPF